MPISIRIVGRPFGALVAILFAVFLMSDAHSADGTYWRLHTDRISVVASGGQKTCTRLAQHFLIYERTLKNLANIQPDANFPPLAVYSLSEDDAKRVFLNERDKKEQRARDVRIYSKYLPGRELNVAAIVDAGDNAEQALQSVLLLYGQSILQSGVSRQYPAWYQVGTANITNGLIIRDDGSVLLNRNVPFEPVVEKGKGTKTKYTLEKLLSATGRELSESGDIKEFSRRSREWALFGLLTTPERRTKFHELALLMRQGTPADEAVRDAFGVTLAELETEFDDGKWRKQLNYKIPAEPLEIVLPPPARLESSQADALLSVVAERSQQQRPQ